MHIPKQKIFHVLIFLCLILAIPSAAASQESYLRVVFTEWFPYTYEKNGRPAGFEIEIFNAVIKQMNRPAVYEMKPWKRCLNNLRQGKADILVSMLKTPEREAYTYYPDEHISISKTAFFAKADRHIYFNGSFEALKDYRIGVIMGFSYGEAFDQADYLDKDGAVDAEMLLTKLIGNRNDLIAENEAVIMATAAQKGMADRIRPLSPAIHMQKLYVGFSKANNLEKLGHEFSIKLRQFKKTQEYKSIMLQYGIPHSEMTNE